MKNIIYILAIILQIGAYSQVNNSHWTHVGPISENLVGANKFETARLEYIAVNPNDLNEIVAGGFSAGMWYSSDKAENWEPVTNTPATGTNGISAVTFNNSDQVIFSNYIQYKGKTPLDRSDGLFRYNPSTGTITTLAALPIAGSYIINAIAVHPNNDNIILVGSTHGMYRSTNGGASWSLVATAREYIREIEFTYDNINSEYNVFYTGTDLDVATSMDEEIYAYDGGEPIMARSTNDGITFTEITSFKTGFLATFPGRDVYATTFCEGKSLNLNESVFYTYSAILDSPSRYVIYKVVYNYSTNSETITLVDDYTVSTVTTVRMTIAHDDLNDRLWMGGTKMRYYDLNLNNGWILGTSSNNDNPDRVHDDIHDAFIAPTDPTTLYLVSDGGFYLNDLATDPNDFDHKNNGLHVALVNGFSGSAQDPNFYVTGLQDIVKINLFDGTTDASSIHNAHENDGGLINAFDEDLIIMDVSSYNTHYKVSTDKGATIAGTYSLPPGNATAFGVPAYFQDPYRERLYYGMKGVKFSQYDPALGKFGDFKSRLNLADYWPYPYVPISFQLMVNGMAFARDDENSVHLITTSHPNVTSGGVVVKYIGNDFDAMMKDDHEFYDSNGDRQWEFITPEWLTGSNMTGDFTTISADDRGKFSYRGIAKSPLDDNMIFVACSEIPDNPDLKVIRYDDNIWSNYSNGIPLDEYPTAIISDQYSNQGLYCVTERAVYYRDASMSSWIKFSNSYPGLFGNQMEINQLERTLRVGTYGRGIWKSYLKCPGNVDYYETASYWSNTLIEGRLIESVATVNAGSFDVVYKANTAVQLYPGFTAYPGSNFRAFITTCTPTPVVPESPVHTGTSFVEGTVENIAAVYFEAKPLTDFKVYPNPTKGMFNVDLSGLEDVSTIEVVSMTNQVVYQSTGGSDKLRIDLGREEAGIYIIRVITADKVYTKQLVKQ